MATTTYKEKNELNDIKFTPLDILKLGGGEVPMDTKPPIIAVEQIAIETGSEHIPNEDVLPYVGSRQDVAYVSSDLKDFVSPVDSTRFRNFESVNLPLSEKQINDGLKQPISSSFRWFAELAKSIFLRQTKTA